MSHERPFRFGCQLSEPIAGMTWQDSARHIESLGYSSVFIPDHFGDQLAPIPAMATALEATTVLRLGSLVLDNDYKHPVVTAKEIATMDLLSGGRVEFGLGAGWMRSDYDEAGMAYDPPGVRVDRFTEAIEVISALLDAKTVNFEGEHYTISNLTGTPAPHGGSAPPLLIGGGSPRMLRFAGAHADIVGVNPSIHSGAIDVEAARDASAERFDKKVQWVKEGAGERYGDVEMNVLTFVAQLSDDRDALADGLAGAFGLSGQDLLESPATILGTHGQIVDLLEQRRERWDLSYHVIHGHEVDAFAPIVAELTGN